jgi:hypothetical protein
VPFVPLLLLLLHSVILLQEHILLVEGVNPWVNQQAQLLSCASAV